MATQTIAPQPVRTPTKTRVHRFTVDQYHQMIEQGILVEGSRVQLLEGIIVEMAGHQTPHATSVLLTNSAFGSVLPSGWHVRTQLPITLKRSEPEPDVAIARGEIRDYAGRHPSGADIGTVVEVCDSSLRMDRNLKGGIYARAGIPVYWIINLIDRQVEVHSDLPPAGTRGRIRYRLRRIFSEGDRVPVVLDGQPVGEIAVKDLLP